MDMSFHKNHNYTTNQKNMSYTEKKIGLVQFFLILRSMQNLITQSVESWMDHTSLNNYKKLCDLDRDLKQTDFILITQKLPLVGYNNTGQRHAFATIKNQYVISLFECKVVSSPLYVLENQCFERTTRTNYNLSTKSLERPSLGLLKHHVNPKILINKSHTTQTAMTHIAQHPTQLRGETPSELSRLTKQKTASTTQILLHNILVYTVNTIGLNQ